MNPGSVMRVARPTDRLAAIAEMYEKGLGVRVLAQFKDAEWQRSCDRMRAAGFRSVASDNSYWDRHGKMFEDLDGYRVVLQNAAWTP